MSTLATVRRRAAAVGASIDETPETWDVWAPAGYVWRSSGNHVLTVNFANQYGETWKREAAADALEQMSSGLEPSA